MSPNAMNQGSANDKPLRDHPDFKEYREATDLIIEGLRADLTSVRYNEAALAAQVKRFQSLHRAGKSYTDAAFREAFEKLISELPESTYTVVLLYPDYATADYGADAYVESAQASSAEEAAAVVQAMASEANGGDLPAEDFRVSLVLHGNVDVALDATSFEASSEEAADA